MSNKKQLKRQMSRGFTILELAAVIVIIGILAAIISVSYMNVTEKARATQLQSDLEHASTQLETYLITNGEYPAEGSEFITSLTRSDETEYVYVLDGDEFHLTATSTVDETLSYNIDADGVVVEGEYVNPAAESFVVALGTDGTDNNMATIQTSDGGYAMAGKDDDFGGGTAEAFIAKYDTEGALEWSKRWDSPASDAAYGMVQASDGGYAIAGYTTGYGAGDNDAFIAKFTSDGTLSWSKTWGGTGTDYAEDIANTSDGGFVIGGTTTSYGAGGNDAFIAKFASDGTLSWSKTWGGTGTDQCRSVIQTSDGGYAIAGPENSFGAGNYDAYIAKFTSGGALSWSKTWGSSSVDYGYSIAQTSDGGYVTAGQTYSLGNSMTDAFVAKYTSDGTLSWNTTFGDGDGAHTHTAKSVIQTSDGGYAMAGYRDASGQDAFLVKFTSGGAVSWNRVFGDSQTDYAESVFQTSDGGYVVGGDTRSYGAGENDPFIAKYNSDGDIAGCGAGLCKTMTTSTASPSATITSPSATVTSPSATITSPSATTGNLTATSTVIVAAQ